MQSVVPPVAHGEGADKQRLDRETDGFIKQNVDDLKQAQVSVGMCIYVCVCVCDMHVFDVCVCGMCGGVCVHHCVCECVHVACVCIHACMREWMSGYMPVCMFLHMFLCS